ncbi:hypothetical protein [Neopusillimonas aromaticivorans]|uniref:hypothetical protein n=1 Tax=Neopusillimonas aromaticivorans TaxID=2979868 RepID=UPI00259263A6|nr:hypothetical protein [Neopusillimonas aromaticivorans]WJJ92583.1 hypothetical protein N7E01_09405 [Neopusillimonas aromaticivorans]
MSTSTVTATALRSFNKTAIEKNTIQTMTKMAISSTQKTAWFMARVMTLKTISAVISTAQKPARKRSTRLRRSDSCFSMRDVLGEGT